MVMWSPCAGAALDPPLWTIVPNIFSLSLPSSASLKMSPSGVCVYYCRTYYKAVRVGGGG